MLPIWQISEIFEIRHMGSIAVTGGEHAKERGESLRTVCADSHN